MKTMKELTKKDIEIRFSIANIDPMTDEVTMKNGNVRLPKLGNQGYYGFSVYDKANKKQTTIPYHRLKWAWFYGFVPKGKVVDHINEDKLDNRLENLQLLTTRENLAKSKRFKFDRGIKPNSDYYKAKRPKKGYSLAYIDEKIAYWEKRI